MQPILETLAKHLLDTASEDLGNTRIIVPNRRAGLFLQRHLAGHISGTSWAPQVFTISEFIDELSILEAADHLDLCFTLYDVYSSSVEHPESMDEFFLWGEMILRDFDELDKYLVDAELLFRNIIDLKELEQPLAGLEPDQLEFIRQFWAGFHGGERTIEKEQFLQGWVLLPVLYRKLRTKLEGRGEAYPGMQYREIAERTARGELDLSWKGRTIVAGFNALNRCEKVIFSALKEQGAAFYWDHDKAYTGNTVKEAGRFLRENMKHYPPAADLEGYSGLADQKAFRIFELPSDVLQAKMVHRILEAKDPSAPEDCTDTALVLCDEELLLPVMMSLPGKWNDINVTMGYPMKNTPVFGLIHILLRLQHNLRKDSGGKVRFYHKDVLGVLLHPYFRYMKEEDHKDLVQEILQKNMITVDLELFQTPFEQAVFQPVSNAGELLDYLKTLFTLLLENMSEVKEHLQDDLDRSFIFHLLTQLNKLEHLLDQRPGMSMGILERFLIKLLGTIRIPFEGEPLSGLQVMGILETRLLDFRRVILLSMNEEIMPASGSAQSNIPYSLRLAFRMPAKEDKDAIYAYYFYRLLQRAERIDLLYNGGTEGLRTGEMSRYLHQLILGRGLQVIRPGLEVRARETPLIRIPHGSDADLILERYMEGGDKEAYLSPSAVNTYIDCSLKFYLRYIAGIGEPDQISEEMDPAGFGTVVHDSLKDLYTEIADRNRQEISHRELSDLLKSDSPERALKERFIKQHFKGRSRGELEGRNIIIFRVMLRYLKKIIESDLALSPFELVSAEEDYRRTLPLDVNHKRLHIRLGGKIDRIDRAGGVLRVIDYKTGQTSQRFTSLESLFQRDYSSRNGAAMQILFYAWLARASFPNDRILPGLYTMKGLFEEHFDPALSMTSLRKEGRIASFAELETAYMEQLEAVLVELFNPSVPFEQRTEDKKCAYCDFAELCQRRAIG
jgi:CRISPR/Cas system-associated exonuclease Cas4 (RecB family)